MSRKKLPDFDHKPNFFLARQGRQIGIDRPKHPPMLAWIVLVVLVAFVGGVFYLPQEFFTGTPVFSSTPAVPMEQQPSTTLPLTEDEETSATVESDVPSRSVPPVVKTEPTPKQPPVDESARIPIRARWYGIHSMAKESKEVVVSTVSDWDAIWQLTGQSQEAPAIDFSVRQVIALFVGQQRGAASIQVNPLHLRGNQLVVPYTISKDVVSPDQDAYSQPYYLMVISKSDHPIHFQQQ